MKCDKCAALSEENERLKRNHVGAHRISIDTIRHLEAENERLKRRLTEAGASTLSERWNQQQAEIERLRMAKISELDRDMRRENEDQRQEIERLRAELEQVREILGDRAVEIGQLRVSKAELLAALTAIIDRAEHRMSSKVSDDVVALARAARAKAKGGKE